MKALQIIRYIIMGILAIYLGYSIFFTCKYIGNREKTHCGKILKKSSEEVAIKHGSETKLYLLIQFDDIGTQAIEVSPTDYMSSEKDQRICFSMNEEWSFFQKLTFTIGAGVLICLGVTLGVWLIYFLLTGNTKW